jgi:hypothetical protein
MEKIGKDSLDPPVRFILDSLVEGIKDNTLIVWRALDTHTGLPVWILGRRINQTQVLPIGYVEPDSGVLVNRFAPAMPDGSWDFSQIKPATTN